MRRKRVKALEYASRAVPWSPDLTSTCLGLKQFRRADSPSDYCYQALVNSPMRITAFKRGALLGQLGGDLSGGYEIEIVNWPNFPMVDALGLEAEKIPSIGGPGIARLKPMCPYWYEVNMEYPRSSTIAWRTEDGRWHDSEGKLCRRPQAAGPPLTQYNTTTGAASPVVTVRTGFPTRACR